MNKGAIVKCVRMAALGAVLGGAVGVAQSLRNTQQQHQEKPSQQSEQSGGDRIVNLKHAPDAQEALHRLQDYKTLNPEAYREIALNLDRLVGIFLLVSGKEPVNVSYELKASRYRHNILMALSQLSARYHNGLPSKQFQEDMDALLKTVDNYVYNIGQQMYEKFYAREVKPQ